MFKLRHWRSRRPRGTVQLARFFPRCAPRRPSNDNSGPVRFNLLWAVVMALLALVIARELLV